MEEAPYTPTSPPMSPLRTTNRTLGQTTEHLLTSEPRTLERTSTHLADVASETILLNKIKKKLDSVLVRFIHATFVLKYVHKIDFSFYYVHSRYIDFNHGRPKCYSLINISRDKSVITLTFKSYRKHPIQQLNCDQVWQAQEHFQSIRERPVPSLSVPILYWNSRT